MDLARMLAWAGCLVVATAVAPGCGNSRGTVVVSGVARAADGKPLPQGRIMFYGGETGPSGEIRAGGTFRIGTFTPTDGVRPGRYKVVIVGASEPDQRTYEEQLLRPAPPAVSLIHPKYNRAETTDLEVEIVTGKNDLVFDLDPPPSPKQ